MSRKQDVWRLEIVKQALRHWNPIGVIVDAQVDRPAAHEYDSYAARILAMVEAGARARDIALRLAAIRVDAMTLGTHLPTGHEAEIAEKLAGWRDAAYGAAPTFNVTCD